MKCRFVLTATLVSLFWQISFSQLEMPVYPKYNEVLNQFFTRYTTKNDMVENQFVLAKKPDGWHAMVMKYPEMQVIKDELFWSRKTKKYNDISFPYYVQAEVDKKKEYLENNSWAITNTEIVPYWGYYGWEMDVIREFSGKKNLCDSLLNAVARSYASYARSFTGYSEFANPQKLKQIPKGQNALDDENLAKYLENEHLAIEFYYKLYQKNPNFETFISNSFNVYSNEIMNAFLTLRYFQNEETAQKELKKGLYDPFYLEMARNYLNSCDKDAILFTNGDMDTYPLLYVQETENFRKDVLVVNLSLLNLGRYIYQLANFKQGTKPLKLNLNPEIYKNESKPYFYVIDKIDNSMAIKNVIDFVTSTDTATKLQIDDNQYYDYIPSKDIYFTINRQNIEKEYEADLYQVDTSFNIHLIQNFLYVADFCVLDILAANNFERPVCFAVTVGNQLMKNYIEYLSQEAMVYKITPIKTGTGDKYNIGRIYPDVFNEKLQNSLHFDKKNYSGIGIAQKRIVSVYRTMFARLASQFIEENQNEKALLILDQCMDLFPNEIAEYDYSAIELINSYFKIKQETKAKSIIAKFSDLIFAKLDLLKKGEKNEDNMYQIQVQAYLLKELVNISNKFVPNEKLTKDIQTKMEEVQYMMY